MDLSETFMETGVIASNLPMPFKTALFAIFGETILSSLPLSQRPVLFSEADPSETIVGQKEDPYR